jgi:hypothetical protein
MCLTLEMQDFVISDKSSCPLKTNTFNTEILMAITTDRVRFSEVSLQKYFIAHTSATSKSFCCTFTAFRHLMNLR